MMVMDACNMERSLKNGDPWRVVVFAPDCACHIKALAQEVEDLQAYYKAIASMAAQFIHPKMTAEQLKDDILKGKGPKP